jgi:hypothetical protein
MAGTRVLMLKRVQNVFVGGIRWTWTLASDCPFHELIRAEVHQTILQCLKPNKLTNHPSGQRCVHQRRADQSDGRSDHHDHPYLMLLATPKSTLPNLSTHSYTAMKFRHTSKAPMPFTERVSYSSLNKASMNSKCSTFNTGSPLGDSIATTPYANVSSLDYYMESRSLSRI